VVSSAKSQKGKPGMLTYHFKNLAEMAFYMAEAAKRARAAMAAEPGRTHKYMQEWGQAQAWDAAANIVRSAKLSEAAEGKPLSELIGKF
jgi:hypothetical protein